VIRTAVLILVLGVDCLTSLLQLIALYVAHGHDLAVLFPEKVAHISQALGTTPNNANGQAITRRHGAIFAKRGRGDDGREECGANRDACGVLHELPAGDEAL
jgi:hypothetical protein